MNFLHAPRFLSQEQADRIFQSLSTGIDWHSVLKADDGTDVPIKRSMAYASNTPTTYRYAGLSFPGQGWTFELEAVRTILNDRMDYQFNSVLLNRYQNGREEIRWHSDKEPQLGPTPAIATINLGASRTFHLMEIATKKKYAFLLGHGDLLLMLEGCQQNFIHAILKEKEVVDPRISLTFRYNDDTLR